jgi:hypothetical protein
MLLFVYGKHNLITLSGTYCNQNKVLSKYCFVLKVVLFKVDGKKERKKERKKESVCD